MNNPLQKELYFGQYNGYFLKEIKKVQGRTIHESTIIYQVGENEKWFIITQGNTVIADFITDDLKI
jgi:hypothetical protein